MHHSICVHIGNKLFIVKVVLIGFSSTFLQYYLDSMLFLFAIREGHLFPHGKLWAQHYMSRKKKTNVLHVLYLICQHVYLVNYYAEQ